MFLLVTGKIPCRIKVALSCTRVVREMQSLVLTALARASYSAAITCRASCAGLCTSVPTYRMVEEAVSCSGTFRRLFNLIPILFILTFFVFIICQCLLGGPIDMLVRPG